MARHRLLYSCGLNPNNDEAEMLIDVETLEGCIQEKDKPTGDLWMILTGKVKELGGYGSSEIPVRELSKRFIEILQSCERKESLAIHKLMAEYGFRPLRYYPGKYPHRYCVPT